MTDSHDPQPAASSRRDFLTGTAVAAGALVATGCASVVPAAAVAQSTSGTAWDDSWTKRLGEHKVVFDVSEFDQSPGAYQVAPIMDNYHEVLGTTDAALGFVLIIRHGAVPMLLNDALWEKYKVGSSITRRDATGDPPTQNRVRTTIETLQKRGVTVLGCNVALRGFGARLARAANADVPAVREEVMAGLLPGVIVQPTGVYALARAQNVGCAYMRPA